MKRYTWALAALALGCETNETSITILHVISPEVAMAGVCTLDAQGEPKAGPVAFDTGASLSVQVPFAVVNNLAVREVDFGSTEDTPDKVITRAEVTPVRFAARFECDTSAYSGASASGLILPRIDPLTSFCVDDRADAASSNANSDVLPAYGAAIPPAETGVAIVRAIPHELGYAIDELFDIARYADECCRINGCSGVSGQQACDDLQDIFTRIDASGSLSAYGTNGTVNTTLQKFADYALYDGVYYSSVDMRYAEKSTPAFPIFLRGVLQATSGYGDVVESNDYSLELELCRNCGYDPGNGHVPKGELPCIRD